MELYMLDTILFVLSAPPVARNEDFISSEVKRLFEDNPFNEGLFSLALKKLVNDGYIENEADVYSITFDGKVFLQAEGGYSSEKAHQKIDGARAFSLFLQGRKIVLLTYVIAFASLLSGLYYLLEIIRWVNRVWIHLKP